MFVKGPLLVKINVKAPEAIDVKENCCFQIKVKDFLFLATTKKDVEHFVLYSTMPLGSICILTHFSLFHNTKLPSGYKQVKGGLLAGPSLIYLFAC